ncbi:MAG: purine-binding chemotaxis protein CheW [Myxococcota bacterium]|jgi:purine-binding chemotaxis protein CheW
MIHICVFKVQGLTLCLPIQQVQQVVEVSECLTVPQAPKGIVGLVNLRGLVVTTIDPRVVLALPTDTPPPDTQLVMLTEGNHPISLRVDEVVGVVEVKDSQMRPTPANLPIARRDLSRGVVVRDDELVLLLDADRIAAAVATT